MSVREGLVVPDRVYTVTELTQVIRLDLETGFPKIWVEGEVSNFKLHSSGHRYFTLKDKDAQLQAVLWRSDGARLKFDLRDGQQVVCRGKISVYMARGQYQLVVESVEPKGKGALQLAFEQLKEKLRAEGLFDPARKRKLPLRPKAIGVVTSGRGAALRDILRTLERRQARVRVLIYPALVQGEGAADQIVAGIDFLSACDDLDVLIVGRGGGSIEDLWAFNEEKVARAIVRSPKPIISAVGHEVDFTIADFVADIRASTPTAAAEMVVETGEAFDLRIENLERRARQSLRLVLEGLRHEVTVLARSRIFENFRTRVLQLGQAVDDLEERAREAVRGEKDKLAAIKGRAALARERLAARIRKSLDDRRAAWDKLVAELDGRSPLAILKKGYALVRRVDGTPVTTADAVRTDDEVRVGFHRGELLCRVESVDPNKEIQ
jgi:exodeoxyribonuclease VII large subunit